MLFKKLCFMAVLISLIALAFNSKTQSQTTPDQYQLTTEGYDTDTTGSASTNDTSDYYWNITKPLGKEKDYDIVGEVKQNGKYYKFTMDDLGINSFRTRYLASDSSGYVQGYTKFGWLDLGVYLPGTTAAGGDTKIPFTLKTGSAIWAFRLAKKN